jgi:hypothetical protein
VEGKDIHEYQVQELEMLGSNCNSDVLNDKFN